jgi:hypothetical protein
MDAKELQHEKARREVELKLEKANKIIDALLHIAANDAAYCVDPSGDCERTCKECIRKYLESEVSNNERNK